MTNPELNPIDESLNETIATAATDWTDETIAAIVTGLRTQYDRWNAEQAKCSRKRVTSKKITPQKSEIAKLAAGLKKLKV